MTNEDTYGLVVVLAFAVFAVYLARRRTRYDGTWEDDCGCK